MKEDVTNTTPSNEEAASPDRRTFLKTAGVVGTVGAVAGAMHGKFGLAPISSAQAQTPAARATQPWWPSRWGAGDEAGASNWITPAKVLDSAKLIKDGKIYKIGRVYEQGMPLFGARAFALRIPGGPTGGPFGENKLIYNDEYLATEIGQVGTQFDGLGHIGIQLGKDGDKSEMRYYNGFTAQEVNDAYGLKKLGTEKLKPLFTRGHLLDLQAVKGAMMDAGQEIMVADVRAALQRQNIQESDIKEGDAIFFHTGWSSLWMKNNDRYNSGEPGIGMEVAKWVIDKGLCLTGADTWAVEVVPNPDKTLAFPVHGELQTKHGILNHENLVFDELIAERKYQFVYIFTPSPIKGATGSNGCPIAVT
jgi:kynurenine formamidase